MAREERARKTRLHASNGVQRARARMRIYMPSAQPAEYDKDVYIMKYEVQLHMLLGVYEHGNGT